MINADARQTESPDAGRNFKRQLKECRAQGKRIRFENLELARNSKRAEGPTTVKCPATNSIQLRPRFE
jgi:hypothetical protein